MNAVKPFVIGLTGSIGMGKSETAKLFAAEGVPVFDADAAIHELYAGRRAAMIEAAFPGTTKDGAVDRAALSRASVTDAGALQAAGRPGASAGGGAKREHFWPAMPSAPIVLLDIPLLLETGDRGGCGGGGDARRMHVQRARVLARPGMSRSQVRRASGAPVERCGKACTGALSW